MKCKGGGDVTVTPVRVSRLKKRRRPIQECALQTLNESLKQSLHAGVSVRGDDGNCKENMMNGLPFIPRNARESVARDGKHGYAVGGKDEGSGTVALQRADSSFQSADTEGGMEGNASSLERRAKPCHKFESNKTVLEFMDNMEQSVLLSAIPSMLGNDMIRYLWQSCADFEQDLERAFDSNDNNAENNWTKKNHEFSDRHEIYHSILGRVDFSHAVRPQRHSIAFPQFRSLCPHASQKECPNHMQQLNLDRSSGHGMRIPPHWYQFPFPKTLGYPSTEMVPQNCIDDERPAKIEQSGKQPPAPKEISGNQDDVGQFFKENRTDRFAKKRLLHFDNDGPSSKLDEKGGQSDPSCELEYSSKYRGKIKIISDRGATIREMCDIDKSKHVVGKLCEGDVRYFVEKKNLDPPPITLDDGDSYDESDDECVAVLRYKIVLDSADCGGSGCFAGDNSRQLVGWISDRGRLADDAYSILREV